MQLFKKKQTIFIIIKNKLRKRVKSNQVNLEHLLRSVTCGHFLLTEIGDSLAITCCSQSENLLFLLNFI